MIYHIELSLSTSTNLPTLDLQNLTLPLRSAAWWQQKLRCQHAASSHTKTNTCTDWLVSSGFKISTSADKPPTIQMDLNIFFPKQTGKQGNRNLTFKGAEETTGRSCNETCVARHCYYATTSEFSDRFYWTTAPSSILATQQQTECGGGLGEGQLVGGVGTDGCFIWASLIWAKEWRWRGGIWDFS